MPDNTSGDSLGSKIENTYDKIEECYKRTGCKILSNDGGYTCFLRFDDEDINLDQKFLSNNCDYADYISAKVYPSYTIGAKNYGNNIYVIMYGQTSIGNPFGGNERLPISVFLLNLKNKNATYIGHSVDGVYLEGVVLL